MDEKLAVYKPENFHFPRQINLIRRLRVISFIVNDITLFVSTLILFLWITDIFGIRIFLIQQQMLYPFTPVLFIFLGITLLFGAKRHLMDTHRDAVKDDRPWWEFGAPIFLAAATAFFGFINLIGVTNTEMLSIFRVSPLVGLCFLLIGVALIPPYTQISHRFHLTQSLVFIVCGLNIYVILEYAYQFFSPFPGQHLVDITLLAAFSFVFFCSGLFLRWSNRGFLGNFTLDSTASIFALRVFLINLISAPLIALFALIAIQQSQYNMYVVLTATVVSFTFISSLLLWMNVKILYGHELEHLLMRESLRSHSIDLAKEQKELQKRMNQLEQEKKNYQDKLNTKNAWQDAAEKMG